MHLIDVNFRGSVVSPSTKLKLEDRPLLVAHDCPFIMITATIFRLGGGLILHLRRAMS
jgi:hypothetical protein